MASSRDYVYLLGTTVINNWYEQVLGYKRPNMNITAATVSNQWDQKGGIVYAYDDYYKKIYRFERDEDSVAPVTAKGFLAIDVPDLKKEIGANSASEIDDIKSDGFGNLYFGLTYPSKDPNNYDPPAHFKPNDCIHLCQSSKDSTGVIFTMIYEQGYGKVVFQRDYLTSKIEEIGCSFKLLISEFKLLSFKFK